MKEKLANIIKYFKWIYFVYYYSFSFFINFLKLFVKPDDKLILFNSFAGRKYDDSPKAIYEAMLSDKRFQGYKFVWAFHHPDEFDIQGAEIIKTDTIHYFITALKARVWITNSSVGRGLNFKGKNTFYFNTWHGTPIKLMGSDIVSTNQSFRTKSKNKTDIMTSQGDFETAIFSRVFGIPEGHFLCCGLPRNDRLSNYTEEYRSTLKKKLGIPSDKKVILYAPTFREYEKENGSECVLLPPMHLEQWKKELADNYVLLFRAHYEVSKAMEVKEDGFSYDMSKYPILEDLMIAADILISDYSSIFFDFSIMGKPMLHFTYDYEKYSANRGMYFDIREKLDGSHDEQGVIRLLKSGYSDTAKAIAFRNEFVNYYGNAVQESLDCIIKHIGG